MNLTLNDFRNVLGKVNDGDVVLKLDGTGIEKANWGRAVINWFRTVRKVETTPAENIRMRAALMQAISASSEGKVIGDAAMDDIRRTLGLGGEGVNPEDMQRPLTRRILKSVIDIIDGATAGDKLIEKNISTLDEKGLLDRLVSAGVKKAMDSAACFVLPEAAKARKAQIRQLFGRDFKGRSPDEVEKFVRLNMAVIREQVFDRLYWTNPSLKDFSLSDLDEVNVKFVIDEEDAVPVAEQTVTDEFKKVVGDLMEMFAARVTGVTKVEAVMPDLPDVEFADERAEGIWNDLVHGSRLERTAADAFCALAEKSGVFAAVQINRAVTAVQNRIRSVFNSAYKENGLKAQQTEVAFKARIAPLMSILNAFIADMARIGPDNAGKIFVKMANRIGAAVVNGDGTDDKIADIALKALGEASKSFSARGMVERYVSANFAYVQDKEPIIKFFMDKIALAGKPGGIDGPQTTALANAQKAAVTGTFGADARRDLEIALLDPLKTAYDNMVASRDPAKIRALREQRNQKVFSELAEKIPGYAQMDEKKKAETLMELKIGTLIGCYGHDWVFNHGIVGNVGGESIRTTVVNGEVVPDPEALAKMENELCGINDRDLEFFTQYVAKGLRVADRNVDGNSVLFHQGKHESVFKDALRDGTISITSVPRNAVAMLEGLITAQIYAQMDDGVYTTSARDMLPKDDKSSPLATAFLTRMMDRFAAAGIKKVPARLKPLGNPADNKAAGMRLQSSGRGDITQIRGFGTFDPARILKLFADVGIDLAPLDGNDQKAKVDILEKVMCLSMIAAMSGFKLDGLAEFAERVIGKPFKDVTLTDVYRTLNDNKLLYGDGMYANITVEDPLNKLAGAPKTAKDIFAGTLALSEANLSAQETSALLTAARELAAGPSGTTRMLPVAGTLVAMTRLPGGALTLRINGLSMRAVFDAQGLVRMIENEIVSKPNDFEPAVVKSALPGLDDVKSGAVPLVRARELYAKVAAAKTGTLPVMFSAFTTERLRDIATRAIDGQFTAADLPKEPPASYNSGAMIEMHENLSKTSAEELDSCVKIAAPAPLSIDRRRTTSPDEETVRNIVADIFLNKDTWEFDAGAAGDAKKGERVRKLLVEYAPELHFILGGLDREGEDLLIYLPPDLREPARVVLREMKKLDVAQLSNANELQAGVREALAAIEAKIDAVAAQLMETMQAKVTALFSPHAVGEAKPDWQKTFAELNGKEGIDETTRQGRFTMKVLKNYFTRSAQVDKRAMLSALIRNTNIDSTDAKQVAELLKGAGPLLQKMLQGLPLSSFDKDTQLALKDMKSRLLPIPDEAVKAQMLELVRSSNGNILSIEVKRSLGAASVGQAFLCTIKTKEHPYIGEECVIKLLRPNVDTSIQREKAIIDGIIGNEDPAMKETFNGQYRKILEEFDLTRESANVGIGLAIYERPNGVETVHTMQMLDGVQSTMTSMILRKADGNTFDNIIETVRSQADEILAPIRTETEVANVRKTVYKAANPKQCALVRRQLLQKVAELNDRRNQLLDITRAWFDNALFGNGFFHGDLHGGNLMTGPSGTTFIDFGNCSRLSDVERKKLTMMLAAVVSGDADHVVSNFRAMMPAEARAAFDGKFAAHSDALKQLTAVLKRGTVLDLMSRVQAFLAIVQGQDVPVPASLQNFVQSYVRLSDIVADIDRTAADIEIAANAVYCETPLCEPVEGEPRTVALLKNIVRTYVGDANTPYSAEAVRAAATDFTTFANSPAGRDEIRNLAHNPELIRSTLVPLMDALREGVLYTRTEAVLNEVGVGLPLAVNHIRDAVDRFKVLDAAKKILPNGQIVPEKEGDEDLFDTIEERLRDCGQEMADEMIEKMTTLDDEGKSAFPNLAAKIDKSVTDICVNVIQAHGDELVTTALLEYHVKAGGFKKRLANAFEDGTETALRIRNVGAILGEQNRSREPAERLTGSQMASISRATMDFLVPSPRPDAAENWCTVAKNRTEMLEAIAYNLTRAATALKLGEGEALSAAAVRHAVLNMGIVDKTLLTSIADLSAEDYNTLLAEAGALDAKNGNTYLSTALSALRMARPLLVKAETPPEPKNNVDDDDE